MSGQLLDPLNVFRRSIGYRKPRRLGQLKSTSAEVLRGTYLGP